MGSRDDPGDASLVHFRLEREGNVMHFSFADLHDELWEDQGIYLRKWEP